VNHNSALCSYALSLNCHRHADYTSRDLLHVNRIIPVIRYCMPST